MFDSGRLFGVNRYTRLSANPQNMRESKLYDG
jgi:hypothetical protein